jgi:hypothetical protein
MRSCALQIVFSVFLVCGCQSEVAHTLTYDVITRLASPAGWCVAEVTEWKIDESQGTSLSLQFTEYTGDIGAVSFDRVGLDLELRWIDSENLEIRYPAHVPFLGNHYGNSTVFHDGNTTVERIQFYKRAVNLRLVPVFNVHGA